MAVRKSAFVGRGLAGCGLGVALVVLLMGATPAAAGVEAALVPDQMTVPVGGVFDVAVVVTDAVTPFNGFDLRIGYDPDMLTYVGQPLVAMPGAMLAAACPSSPFHVFSIAPDSSQLNISYIMLCAGASVTGPGTIYTLRFQAKDIKGSTTLTFLTGTRFYDAGIRVGPDAAVDATVQIGGPSPVTDLPSVGAVGLRAVPNPFNPATRVAFRLDQPGPVRLRVFDLGGRLVRTLLDGWRDDGEIAVTWQGDNEAGRRQAGGVYLFLLDYRVDGRPFQAAHRAVLVP